MLCGTSWEVLKNRLFQWGHLKNPVNFNVKFHIKKSVSSCFPYMLYSVGDVTLKPGQDESFPKKIKQLQVIRCLNGFRMHL